MPGTSYFYMVHLPKPAAWSLQGAVNVAAAEQEGMAILQWVHVSSYIHVN